MVKRKRKPRAAKAKVQRKRKPRAPMTEAQKEKLEALIAKLQAKMAANLNKIEK